MFMVFEVFTQVRTGAHFPKDHAIYAKFLMAKIVSRQTLVSPEGSGLTLVTAKIGKCSAFNTNE